MDGFINIKKERGETSFHCVAAIKKIIGEKKVGHGGTLDPEASGVLPVGLGKGTRCTGYFLRMPKTYRAEITLGVTSDTQDIWGEVVNSGRDLSFITKELFEETLKTFVGRIMQIPPMYSALKRDGVPLYKLARQGETIEREPRPVTIYDITLENFTNPTAVFTVKCSGGTYIRTLCNDIGEKLGVGGVMSSLDRISYGEMDEETAVTLSELQKAKENGTLQKYILPIDYPIKNYPRVEFFAKECEDYKNGKKVVIGKDRIKGELTDFPEIRIIRSGSLFAIAQMKIEEGSERIELLPDKFFGGERPVVAALGNFDGVHKGHRKLLEAAIEEAKKRNASSMMYTFACHSLKVLKPDAKLEILSDGREKEIIAKTMGVDIVYFEEFTKKFASLTPEEFVRKILVNKLGATAVVTGYNYTFGAKGSGNVEMLREICGKYGIDVVVIPPVKVQGEIVSSTMLRELIKSGRVDEYEKYTGRQYSIKGKVVKGKQLGRVLGFPTANVVPGEFSCLPPSGVYITDTIVDGKTVHGISNVGNNPTFDEQQIRLETFLFNFSGNIYGEEIEVFLIKRTRGEIRFESAEELKLQVDSDIAGGLKYFEEKSEQN